MFNNLDYIIIAAFFVVLLLIPAITAIRSKEKGAKEYFKSSNSMPWWLIGFYMVESNINNIRGADLLQSQTLAI